MGTTILAGDIGGTKTAVAAFELRDSVLVPVAERIFVSSEHDSLEAVLRIFLDAHRELNFDAACFGVAGAVIDGQSKVTNLSWRVSEGAIADVAGVRSAVLLNDLEAAAYGMLDLAPADRVTLNPGSGDASGNIAVVAAGTGLGEALLVWDGDQPHAVASEGGHAAFAPRNDDEIELLRFLRTGLGNHISTERVLSGPGLHNIYRFARQRSGKAEPGWVADRIAGEDPGAVISELALETRDAICQEALTMFASIYGAAAGDLALTGLTIGGVYLAGGIAPKILPALQRKEFMSAFTDKGRFGKLLKRIPVHVALDPRVPLLGAARHASDRLASLA